MLFLRQEEINLDHADSAKGVQADQGKIKAVAALDLPKNKSDLSRPNRVLPPFHSQFCYGISPTFSCYTILLMINNKTFPLKFLKYYDHLYEQPAFHMNLWYSFYHVVIKALLVT